MKRRFFVYGVGLLLAGLILLAAGALYYGHSMKTKKKLATPPLTAPSEPQQTAADTPVAQETPVEDVSTVQPEPNPQEVVPTPPEQVDTPAQPEDTTPEPEPTQQTPEELVTPTPVAPTETEPAAPPEPTPEPTPTEPSTEPAEQAAEEPTAEPQPTEPVQEPAEEPVHTIAFAEDVQNLLDSLSKPVPTNRFPLIKAVEKGDMEQARQLLAEGAPINAQDVAGFTALAAAIQANQTEAALWLIEQQADVNMADVLGVTPLMRAARLGNPKLVRKLLECGADKTLKDLWQNSSYAYAKDSGNDEVLLLLVD